MLGSAISGHLSTNRNLEIFSANRSHIPNSIVFDAKTDSPDILISRIKPHYVINSIMARNNETGIKLINSFYLHSVFQKNLMKACFKNKSFLIQPATDAVFQNSHGNRNEKSIKNGNSIYSRTKILGERYTHNTLFLRTSLLGFDLERSSEPHLMSWLLRKPLGSTVYGYTNYLWNGISTKVFSQIVEQIILSGFNEPRTQHIVPDNSLSKFQILQHIARSANRLDLIIAPMGLEKSIDLRLSTEFLDFNSSLFNLAGYSKLPTIQEMIDEMIKHHYS